MRKHRRKHHKESPHHEEPASKKIKPNLDHQSPQDTNRQNDRDGFESFSCEKCGIYLSSSKILEMHKVMVHP